MAKGYALTGTRATSGANLTILNTIGSATIRPHIFYVMAGFTPTPADAQALLLVQRATAVGTAGSSVTPEPLEGDDIAAVSTAGQAHSAEPTYAGSPFLRIPIYQRSTFQFYAREKYEFATIKAASANIGLYMSTISAGTPQTVATFHIFE